MIRSQVFPRNENALEWCLKNVKEGFKVDKSTGIVSAGSCFAREIKNWLLRNDYNYLTGETNKMPWVSHKIFKGDEGRLPTEHGSVAWERIYNIDVLYQLLAAAVEGFKYDNRLHPFEYKDKSYVADLLRNRIVYPSKEIAEEDIEDHTNETIKIIKEAEVFIFTLGMTEASSFGGFTVGSYQREYNLDCKSYRTGYINAVHGLGSIYGRLKKINPDIKVLLSVSPVPFNGTFRTDIDAISANCESKSLLRAAAGVVCDVHKDMYYFPSYEIATVVGSLIGAKIYDTDNHHVRRDMVDMIMNVFTNRYING